MDISYIEHFTDNLGKVRQHTTPKRKGFGIKRTKYLSILAVLLIVGSITGFGMIFSYFTQQTTDVTLADTSLLEWDETPAEDLQVDEDITGVGNDDFTYEHWLNYSSEADNDITVTFTWTGNITSEGITANVSWWDTDHWTLITSNPASPSDGDITLSPGQNLKVQTYYKLDEKIEYRTDYQMVLTID